MFGVTNPPKVSVMAVLNTKPPVEARGPVLYGPGSRKPSTPFLLRTLQLSEFECIEKAKRFAMEQSIRAVLLRQTQTQQSNQLNTAKKTQTYTLLNRIYVGSISYEVTEESLRQAFSSFGALKNVAMSWDPVIQKHKGFAFLEFEFPEGAHLAIEQMNGISFGGRSLRVGRPSNLTNADEMITELRTEYKLEKRIYISGIHPDLTEDDIALVFEAFGKIAFCKLIIDLNGLKPHRGFGYIEFETVQSVSDAVASMNQFNLGGQLLRVCKAMSPPEGISSTTTSGMPAAAAVAAASVTAKVLSMETEQLSVNSNQPSGLGPPGLVIPTLSSTSINQERLHRSGFDVPPSDVAERPALPPPQTLGSWEGDEMFESGSVAQLEVIQPGAVPRLASDPGHAIHQTYPIHPYLSNSILILRNMVGPEDCDDELEGEVESECSQYGLIDRVVIDQQSDPHGTGERIIKVFVQFSAMEDLYKAIGALDGRYFAGRQIVAEPYDFDAFISGDLSG